MNMFRKKDELKSTTTLLEDGYIRDTNDPTQQPPRTPDASLNDSGYSSTPGPSTSYVHPNRAPQELPRSVPNNALQSNQAPPRPARPQQPVMDASIAGQSSATSRPTSQDLARSARGNSRNSNSSRHSSAHSRTSSINAPLNNTAATVQRNSRASTTSRYSSASSSNRDPFQYDSPEWRRILNRASNAQ
ncbi:uncharacterized protein EAF01_007665 [Botrytis porri]|uniref:uncharacterized protein n=1 Tax=Botrytis porri TaxID=87229 RepID=UPI001901B572|nr:uncharacterized protein EAF01_007665 [Botrytis porri]KAF7900363.1 hypothetical protein EAF01_007665 [Botrytis porri]